MSPCNWFCRPEVTAIAGRDNGGRLQVLPRQVSGFAYAVLRRLSLVVFLSFLLHLRHYGGSPHPPQHSGRLVHGEEQPVAWSGYATLLSIV